MEKDKVINKVARDLREAEIIGEEDAPLVKAHLNLIWTAGWEDRNKVFSDKRSLPVCQLNENKKLMLEFHNIQIAARKAKYSRGTIYTAIKSGEKTRRGHYWVYKEERELPEQ